MCFVAGFGFLHSYNAEALHVFSVCSDVLNLLNAEVLHVQVFVPVMVILKSNISIAFIAVIIYCNCRTNCIYFPYLFSQIGHRL